MPGKISGSGEMPSATDCSSAHSFSVKSPTIKEVREENSPPDNFDDFDNFEALPEFKIADFKKSGSMYKKPCPTRIGRKNSSPVQFYASPKLCDLSRKASIEGTKSFEDLFQEGEIIGEVSFCKKLTQF